MEQKTTTRSERFYWDWVVFLVEDTLFKVPRHKFMQSAVFETTFSLPAGLGGADPEGHGDEHPFELRGIKKKAFENLLRVMYPFEPPNLSQEDWTSVLKLSNMWEFHGIRALAIRELSKINLTALEKILLARECRVTKWLLDGYQELARRSETITFEEVERIGWETAIRLLRVREAFFMKGQQSHLCSGVQRTLVAYCAYCRGNVGCSDHPGKTMRDHDFTQDLRNEFAMELTELTNLSPSSSSVA